MKAVQSLGQTPAMHFGEFRDSSARPPVRYASAGKLLGPIGVYCENRSTDVSFCHHLTISPTILPHSHWSCCGGKDRESIYCRKTPHPGEYRDSSVRPSVRYSSFCDYAGKIRLHCCTKDSVNEGHRCAHLDTLEKIITCSHWSCCGNTEKHSSSCLITAGTKDADHKMDSGSGIRAAQLASSGFKILMKSKVSGFPKLRPVSVTFDPEVDSEFTDYEYDDNSESELSIEEYNDGPAVWSPFRGQHSSAQNTKSEKTTAHKDGLQDQLAVEAARLQLEIKSMYAYIHSEHSSTDLKVLESARNLLELKLLELEGKFREIDSLKLAGPVLRSALRPPSESFEAKFNVESAVVKASTSRLQNIDELNKKLVQSGFNVDLSRVRSKLLNLSRGGLGSNEQSSVVSTPRRSVLQLPEVVDDPLAPSKVL